MDIDSMSLDQLQAEFVRLGNELSTLNRQRLRINKRLNGMRANVKAKATVGRLNTDERAALRAELEKG
jgi:chaperonin cofactor prefoldin